MRDDEFDTQMNRLKSVFGDKAYPDERATLLWRDVRNLSGRWLEGAVDQLIASCRQAPLSSEFGPLIGIERERVAKLEKDHAAIHDWNQPYKCEFCRDRGVYLCLLNGDRSAPYAFRCHCPRGQNDQRRQIPQYKQSHAKEGFTYYEVDWARRGA